MRGSQLFRWRITASLRNRKPGSSRRLLPLKNKAGRKRHLGGVAPLSGMCCLLRIKLRFGVIKWQFDYTKERLRGLVKNTAQLVMLFNLSNLRMS
jgi:IS5 family transposase